MEQSAGSYFFRINKEGYMMSKKISPLEVMIAIIGIALLLFAPNTYVDICEWIGGIVSSYIIPY